MSDKKTLLLIGASRGLLMPRLSIFMPPDGVFSPPRAKVG